jgi:hypothetical protein
MQLQNRTLLARNMCPRPVSKYAVAARVQAEAFLPHRSTRCALQVYNKETISCVFGRWIKLHRDFWSKKKGFDLSKVPDLYDCVKFDAIHNSVLQLPAIPELFYTGEPCVTKRCRYH